MYFIKAPKCPFADDLAYMSTCLAHHNCSVAQGLARSTDVVAAILLLMAAAIAGYALFLYLQRSKKLELIGDEVRGLLGLLHSRAVTANRPAHAGVGILLFLQVRAHSHAVACTLSAYAALQEEEVDLEGKGAWAIVGVITLSLSAIFVISLVDFFMCL